MHKHNWTVYGTSILDYCILLECDCGATATVNNPTAKEWNDAFYSPSTPYRWTSVDDRLLIYEKGDIT